MQHFDPTCESVTVKLQGQAAITGNTAQYGGGVVFMGQAMAAVEMLAESLISENKAAVHGAGVAFVDVIDAVLSMSGSSNMSWNVVNLEEGLVNTAGGGVSVLRAHSMRFELSDSSVFEFNLAESGGALSALDVVKVGHAC
jgi:hypothetical protein